MSEDQNIEQSQENNKTESLHYLSGDKKEDLNENISRAQIIGTTQPETQNSQLQTGNMEVHHHPKVEKKNFKEYLLEGLMIFIAVTMGFIAENVREHFAEEKTKSAYLETFEHELLKNKDVFNKSQSRFRELYTSKDTMANIFLRKEENQD